MSDSAVIFLGMSKEKREKNIICGSQKKPLITLTSQYGHSGAKIPGKDLVQGEGLQYSRYRCDRQEKF